MPDGFPRPSWAEFAAMFGGTEANEYRDGRWSQGEHVFISAQTGAGKTELLLRLLDYREHAVIMVTKPRDPIFKSPFAKGYAKMVGAFRPQSYHRKILLTAPEQKTTAAMQSAQYQTFGYALDSMYHQRGWAVGVDELAYMSEQLRLSQPIASAHHMGRALGLTYITATQRPKRVPVIVPQSASHAFIGKTMRKDDLLTLAELGGDVRETRRAIESLRDQHDFVYVDTQSQLPIMIVNTRR